LKTLHLENMLTIKDVMKREKYLWFFVFTFSIYPYLVFFR
jgi:hypothetical protein